MGKCAWLICEREATHQGHCHGHWRVYGPAAAAATPEPVVEKPIAVKSQKRKVEDKALRKMFKDLMAISDRCQLKIKGVCNGKAQGFDHIQKTSPANRLDPNNLKLACNACNLAKELHPLEAMEAGISKSKFKST